MNKLVNFAIGYLSFGLLSGFYFRELTRGKTGIDDATLGAVHGHAIALGMMFLLIVALFVHTYKLDQQPRWKTFLSTYNIGLSLTLILLTIRGTLDILGTPLSKGLDASIAGMAGIGHILLTVGLVYFFLILKRAIREESGSN